MMSGWIFKRGRCGCDDCVSVRQRDEQGKKQDWGRNDKI
jgi:hypothetical protein